MDTGSSSLDCVSNLQRCSTQDGKYDYKDVPDLITSVKQEILDEEVLQNANKDFKLEYEQEYARNQFILLDCEKTNINEKVKISEKITGEIPTSNDVKPKSLFKLHNVEKIVTLLKNSLKKNEETLDSRKKTPVNLHTNKNSDFVKKDSDSSTDYIQRSSEGYITVGEVNIKSENEKEDDRYSELFSQQKETLVKIENNEMAKEYDKLHEITFEDWRIKNEVVDIKEEEMKISEVSTSLKGIAENQQGNKCQHCSYQTDHLNESEEDETFRCGQCNFQTTYKNCLTVHLAWHKKLENINMFKCTQCTYQTCRRSNLERHVLMHKNYQDDMLKGNEYNYQTVSSRHLEIHLRRHNTKKSTVKCDHCDLEAIRKATLINYLAKNKNCEFKCDQCDYRARTKKYLSKHCLRHKNPKTTYFKCDYCNYKTIQKAALNKHLIQHTVSLKTRDMCDHQTSIKIPKM